jgi:hypothetical protein
LADMAIDLEWIFSVINLNIDTIQLTCSIAHS